VALGQTGDDRASELLTQGLRDADATVRGRCDHARRARTPRARDVLIDLTRSASVDDRAAAISGLRGFADPNATQRLGS